MSLAPHEQQALARIEESLASSDPRLAAMLATFTPPFAHRLRARCRSLILAQSSRPLIPLAVAMVTICLTVTGWLLLGHPRRSPCPAQGERARVLGQMIACKPAHRSAVPSRPGSGASPAARMSISAPHRSIPAAVQPPA